MRSKRRLGLVLSGGGACGAYEIGVIRVLARLGLTPHVIAGASIGALNGAIAASARRFRHSPSLLESLWETLDPEAILRPRYTAKAQTLSTQDALEVSPALAEFSPAVFEEQEMSFGSSKKPSDETFALLDDGPLTSILAKAIDFKHLRRGPDLYISIFPGNEDPGLIGALQDLIHWFRADRRSEFLRVQDYTDAQILTLLKASAAIPLAFQAQTFGNRVYRDGGIGAQGNTPIEPLAKTNCTHGIVVYLDHRFPLNPGDWPGIELVEIRPSKNLQEDGILRAMLDFSPERIRELVALGEEDASNSQDLKALKKEFGGLRSFFKSFGW